MTELLVIGGELNGRWFRPDGYANTIVWCILPETLVTARDLGPDLNPLAVSLVRKTATRYRYFCPGWRITLQFYVADDLPRDSGGQPIIPRGTVLPGWIHGEVRESSPVCQVCYRLADSPAANLCHRHVLELLEGLDE